MKKFLLFTFSSVIVCCLSIVGCTEKYPGYEEINKNIYKKLIAFGDSGITIGEGQYVHLTIVLEEDTNERVISTIIPVSSLNTVVTETSVLSDLSQKVAGDMIKYIAPQQSFHFDQLIDHDSAITSIQTKNIEVLFEINNISSNDDSLRNYLQTCAQNGSMEETEAIRNWQVTCKCEIWKELNDLSFAYYHITDGDSIKSGKEIMIRYTTHLLNGQKLDSLTEMKFTFGKPGQLIQGFQWGLAKLKEGERAGIFMPSIWAFGEDGIPGGPVPPRTPVYIDVEVVEVN